MNLTKFFGNGTSSPPYLAALAYAGLLVVLVAATAMSVQGIFERKATVESLNDIISRLEGRGPAGRAGPAAVKGSYFLEGATVTVAGAALLQRVVGTVTRYGGSVLSSQVDLQGTQSKEGFLTVIVSCDMEQPVLQQIVYDLEAGMPFLFVDQVDVQAPALSTSSSGGKLRVLLAVSGQWQGAR